MSTSVSKLSSLLANNLGFFLAVIAVPAAKAHRPAKMGSPPLDRPPLRQLITMVAQPRLPQATTTERPMPLPTTVSRIVAAAAFTRLSRRSSQLRTTTTTNGATEPEQLDPAAAVVGPITTASGAAMATTIENRPPTPTPCTSKTYPSSFSYALLLC